MGGMKSLLIALFVALLMVGCGEADLSDPDVLEDVTADAVDWSKLQDRSGVTYLQNTEEPYSGYAKRAYEDGQHEILAQFKDGYVVRFKQWEKNGTPRWDIGYTEGKVAGSDVPFEDSYDSNFSHHDGLQTEWYENGQKWAELNYRDGKLDGLAVYWHENGQKMLEENYNDDKLMSAMSWKFNGEKCPVTNVKNGNGVLVRYNEDGSESIRYTYKDGVLHGLLTNWYDNGQKFVEGFNKDDKRDGLWTTWYKNGQKREEENFKDDKLDGLAVYWHENGQKREESNWMDDKPHGLSTFWYESGHKEKEKNYENGELHGLSTFWYESGQKMEEKNYKDGKPHGLSTFWLESGQKRSERNYKDGKLMSAEAWKPNGEKCSVTNVNHGNGVVRRYNEDGSESIHITKYKDGEPVFY